MKTREKIKEDLATYVEELFGGFLARQKLIEISSILNLQVKGNTRDLMEQFVN